MSRIDKVVPGAGNFRAPLLANFAYSGNPSRPDFAHADLNKVICVSLNASGLVQVGTPFASATGLVGVICLGEPAAAGDVIDVYQTAEIVEFTLANLAAAAAGTAYASNADGLGGYAAGAGGTATSGKIGWTVEATRLVVRVTPGAKLAS